MFEPRDRSAPMDIDSAPVTWLAEAEDGPARKRLHSDLSSPSPFTRQPSQAFTHTPFLFNAPPLPPAPKFEPYDPNRWARTDFGFGGGQEVEEVEMAEAAAEAAACGSGDGTRTGTCSGTGADSATPAAPAPSTAVALAASVSDASEPTHAPRSPNSKKERPIAGGAVARVRRRRKQWARRNDDASDDENDSVVATARANTYNFHMDNPAVRHSEIPAILLGYVQFVFNASLVVLFLYVATQFILAIRRDMQERIEEYSVEILQEIAGCTQAYMTNRCEPSLRVPAMEPACFAWETCMNRDPKVVGRARVGAETFAGVINSFVDPISWKTMGFTLVTLTFLIVLTNSALFNLRAKHQHNHAPPTQPPLGVGVGVGGMGMYPPPYMMHHPGQLGGPAPHGPNVNGAVGQAPQEQRSKMLGWFGKK